MRILCIDQDDLLVAFLGELLTKSGYSMLGASTLEVGLKMLSRTAVDAVVLGIEVPEREWQSVARRIRSRHPQVAIILYGTMNSSEGDLPENVDGFVRKDDISGLMLLLRVLAAEQRQRN